jgi:hypothetical protein
MELMGTPLLFRPSINFTLRVLVVDLAFVDDNECMGLDPSLLKASSSIPQVEDGE